MTEQKEVEGVLGKAVRKSLEETAQAVGKFGEIVVESEEHEEEIVSRASKGQLKLGESNTEPKFIEQGTLNCTYDE